MQLGQLLTGPAGLPTPLLLLTMLTLLLLLLLQDKKRRQYLITALADTKVDYKGESVAHLHTLYTHLPPSTRTLTHHSPAPPSPPCACSSVSAAGAGQGRAAAGQ